jgi:hypothetical protein
MHKFTQSQKDYTGLLALDLLSTTILSFVLLLLFNRILSIQDAIADSSLWALLEAFKMDINENMLSFYLWFGIIFFIWFLLKCWQINREVVNAKKNDEKIDKLCEKIDSLIDVIKEERKNGDKNKL